jgi:hypothetical protein
VVLVSMLRLIVLHQFEKGIDLTYTLGKLIIISSIEIDLAIIAANAPSLKIYWTKYISSHASTKKSQYESHTLSTLQGPKVLSQASSCHISSNNMRNNTISPDQLAEEGDISMQPGAFYNHSQEALWNSNNGIIVTSSVGVVVQAAPQQQDELEANYYMFDK